MSQPGQPPARGSRPARRPPGVGPATGSVPAAEGGDPTPPRGRRRWVLPVVLVVLVLVVGGAVVGVLRAKGAAPTGTASTLVVPSPTPTVQPVARTATSAFAAALPVSVLQYALASSVNDDAWLAKGALESYTETFTDGSGTTLGLQAGQWATPQEATAALGALTAAATPTAAATTSPAASTEASAAASPAATAGDGTSGLPRTGTVDAAGQAVGSYVIVDNGDGTGTATWTNGTALLQLSGPVAEIARAYSAFPL